MRMILGDTDASLRETMATIKEFRNYSGLKEKRSKSTLILIDEEGTSQAELDSPIPVTSSFKYLGVQVTPNIKDFCCLNISPPLLRFRGHTKNGILFTYPWLGK